MRQTIVVLTVCVNFVVFLTKNYNDAFEFGKIINIFVGLYISGHAVVQCAVCTEDVDLLLQLIKLFMVYISL